MGIELIHEHPDEPREWQSTVDEYLASNAIPYTKATPLQGGHSAYVWRVDGYDDDSAACRKGEPCVLKYAEGTGKGAPDSVMDPTRMRFEARALTSEPVRKACLAEPSVEVPQVLRTTDQALLMTWGGEIDLRSAYTRGRCFDPGTVGAKLGRWLAHMHRAGTQDSESAGFENATMDNFKNVEVENLRTVMLANGFEETAVSDAIVRLEIPASVETLTAWDFRPMNALLRFEDSVDAEPGITVIDWEGNTYGCPVWDLRLWVTEALVLEAKYGNKKTLLSSFLTAYRCSAGEAIVSNDFIAKLALSVGSTLDLLVPMGLWKSTEEEVRYWRDRAVHFIRAGVNRDMRWIASSELGPLCEGKILGSTSML